MIPLSDVYVMLQATRSERRSPAKERPDLTPLPSRLERAGIPASDQPQLDSGNVPEAEHDRESPPPPIPLSEALMEQKQLAFLGEAGAGKSIALQFVALYFAQEGIARARLGLDEDRVPVLIRLNERSEELSQQNLEHGLAAEVKRFLDVDVDLALELVRRWRDKGRLAVLLDGLDEVPNDDKKREQVAAAIQVFSASERGKSCRVIVASRTVGYLDLAQAFRGLLRWLGDC